MGVENTPDSSEENQPETKKSSEENVENNEEKSKEESSRNEETEEELASQPILNVRDVMSCLNSDIDLNSLSDTDIKTLITTLFDHSKKVEAMKENAVQILANRLR